ncbi:MAG: hypothetical protein C0459_12685 [Chitinophaga sp.]|jgi:hypothetical protein|nr:hypothetical protein [Chitinophaga sp.]
MKTLQTITTLLICFTSFGQGKIFYNVLKADGDSTFWFKYQTTIAQKLKLPLLDTSTKTEYFRIWTNKQAIDLWQEKDGEFKSMLTTWTDEYPPYNEEPTNRTFIKTKQISGDSLLMLRELLISNDILFLPTDDSIKGWQKGVDGNTYIIEHSKKDSYSFKSYWTPKAQDSLKEAILVQTFVDSVLNLTNAQTFWKEFSKEIPFESYYNGGPSVTIRILTEKQRKEYKKERQNYRQQQIPKTKVGKQ